MNVSRSQQMRTRIAYYILGGLVVAALAGDADAVISPTSGGGVWTNVAGNVMSGSVVGLDAKSVRLATGAVTQTVARSVFPAGELKRMQAALGVSEEPAVPSAIAPAWRDFAAKCAARTATRGDLIGLKRLVAASGLDAAAQRTWTQRARELYRKSRQESADKDKDLKGSER